MAHTDAQAQVEAVLDVIAPKTPPEIAEALGVTVLLRNPLIRVEYDGVMVAPNDEQIRALAEQIVAALRTASGPERTYTRARVKWAIDATLQTLDCGCSNWDPIEETLLGYLDRDS